MRTVLVAAILLFASTAGAQQVGPRQQCRSLGTLINGLALTSNRTASYDGSNDQGGWGLAVLSVVFVDANASITKMRATCTVSLDGNVTALTPQEWTSTAGVMSRNSTGIFDVGDGSTGTGSLNFPIRLDIEGYPSFSCVFSSASGTPASGDTVLVTGRICTKG